MFVSHNALFSLPSRRSSDLQQKLFERFYRVENETVTSISGFGIGLYIVAEILKYHGTKIEVESEPGQGSVDRKSTRLNSSHVKISYAVFCLKKTNKNAKSTN